MDVRWDSLKKQLHPEVFEAVKRLNFKEMTVVQAACIPQLINYKDVATEAVTGSGKTLAFLIPVLHILKKREGKWKPCEVGALIIAPTRELATQINNVLKTLLDGMKDLKSILLIGGTSIQTDMDNFLSKGANIIIATPGRLEDLLMRREDTRIAAAMKTLEVLILDEADCLLNLGFEKSLNTILQVLPKQRRTGLFSATQTTEVLKLIRAGLRNPVSVVVRDTESQGRVPSTLENFYCEITPEKKFDLLVEFIKHEKQKKMLIFFPTCACVEYFAMVLPRFLSKEGITNIKAMHGKMKEKARFAMFNKFRESTTGILCCTDVLARGIDITKRIDWVIQFDPPPNPASFIHRAGRAARNGDEGKALLILQPSEMNYIDYIKVSQKVDVALKSMDHLNLSTSHSDQLRKFQMKDRIYFDKAMRAFVSYYKAYTKHECSLILRAKDLELGKIAKAFGLLKFPKMSELYGKKPEDFIEEEIDVNNIPYSNKQREASRQAKLEKYNETGVWPGSNDRNRTKKANAKTESWGVSKEKRLKKKEKKLTRKRKSNALTVEEFEELEKNSSLVKKLKPNVISDED